MLTFKSHRYTLLPRLKNMLNLDKVRIHGELVTQAGFDTDKEHWLVSEMKYEYRPVELWSGNFEDYFCGERDLPLTDDNQF